MSTINDVSRLAGVSKATVSRVLSGSRGVKEASRQAVLKAVDELNYRPNVILNTRDTVAFDTPARRDTSLIVDIFFP